nr:hypothetical protein [Tanacetum cinerariifolium]
MTYYDFAIGKVPPRKARKYKKVASPSRKLSPVKEAELVKVKRPAKKSTTAPTTCVVIRDTPGVSVSNKKAPAKGDGVGFQPKVPDESEDKTTGTDEGIGTKPGVIDVSTYDSESENESWGNSEGDNDDLNDDDDDDENANDDDSKGDDDKADIDDDEHDEEYESNDDYENVYEEEDVNLYKDVDMRSLGAEHEQERKGDEEMTDADQNVSQKKSYEQVVEDAHVTLTS